MAGDFAPKLAPVDKPRLGKAVGIGTVFLKSLLAQRHKYFFAAAIQLGITTLFPGRFALVPLATLGLAMLTTHLIDRLTPAPTSPPAPMLSVVPGRATALLPRPDGTFGSAPSNHGLVVFNLGVQFNHPQGQLCPYAKDLAEKFTLMTRELLSRRHELGLLSVTNWTGGDAQPASGAGPDTMLMSYYFRDVESIHRFAHEEMHRAAWDWYQAVRPHHIGIFHETFVVPAHGHESIYVNCRPLLLGAGLVKLTGEEKADETEDWRNVLVSADHVGLKSQWQRLNRDADGVPRGGSVQ
ncbi:hypothetical protein E4U43_006170 [Claviceps pusilla]|uniref:DUF4188 domain-containing protein n=1 Tax=Claviceps pusilla TaxID=123648 RepID=A0A9P7N2M2_9HYPO|nr:hypothetical protein E4U43_006170 [Claviceps pusilla]